MDTPGPKRDLDRQPCPLLDREDEDDTRAEEQRAAAGLCAQFRPSMYTFDDWQGDE